MPLITEKVDVQNKIINCLISVGWDYLPPSDVLDLRGGNLKEPFLTSIAKEKLKELNKGLVTDENVDDVIKRLRFLPTTIGGNEEFLGFLKGQKPHYFAKESRERNLKFIDYENFKSNSFTFTQEFEFEDKDIRRADIILFINGFPTGIIENKSPAVEEAEEEALDQIRLYTERISEFLKFPQFYVTCNGIRLYYGPTWKYESKTFYRWRGENGFNFDNLVKTFFDKGEILETLRKYVVFLRIDEELQKYILKQHQRRTIRKILKRVLKEKKNKGLIWHTQGAYKTLTMIVCADELRRLQQLENPTILAVIDRLELESQIKQNFEGFGFPNVEQGRAKSKQHLQELLATDYRGLIITTIQKFEGMSRHVNKRNNIIILIDEAHRSQEGDLGNYMWGALPNAYYFGFTGTPIDKSKIGRGTFLAFGYPDEPYLDKYSIDESIEDKTTVPLYYTLTPTDLHVGKKMLEEEFFKVVEGEGIVSMEGVNKVIEKAEKLKAVLKAPQRVDRIARHIAEHYRESIEPLGFKAFIVAVDREACALYKEAMDKYLPPEYSKVVYTRDYKDSKLLRKYHIGEEDEKNIRKAFKSEDELPKILIVTQKLLTGYDAPILYAMYLDKPLKDHTLLQAIARINRPYRGKTCGIVIDYIGVFENLQRALVFDSKDISRGLIDMEFLKVRFKDLMSEAREVLVNTDIEDKEKRIANIIEYFFEEGKRKEFIKIFNQIQEIYEIISPDEFLRDYIRNYQLLVQVYKVVYNTYNPEAERKRIHRELLKKTEELIRESVELNGIIDSLPVYEINKDIANLIKADKLSERVKIVNLHRSLRIYISENKEKQPFLISISEKIEEIIKQLRERQRSVKSALGELTRLSEGIASSKKEQEESELNKEEFSIFWILKNYAVNNPEDVARRIYKDVDRYQEWLYNEKMERKLRTELYKLLSQSYRLKPTGISRDKGKPPYTKFIDVVNNILKMHRILVEET